VAERSQEATIPSVFRTAFASVRIRCLSPSRDRHGGTGLCDGAPCRRRLAPCRAT
jgi:hypothetical protein